MTMTFFRFNIALRLFQSITILTWKLGIPTIWNPSDTTQAWSTEPLLRKPSTVHYCCSLISDMFKIGQWITEMKSSIMASDVGQISKLT